MATDNMTIRSVSAADRDWILQVVRGWGADFIVTRGRTVFPCELPGLVAETSARPRSGLLTYEIVDNECEIITLDAFEQHQGIGTALIEALRTKVSSGCRRIWLITTNDNLDAIRFYQRRGFRLVTIHRDALKESRRMKPSIPEVGQYGIALYDEIELEMLLT